MHSSWTLKFPDLNWMKHLSIDAWVCIIYLSYPPAPHGLFSMLLDSTVCWRDVTKAVAVSTPVCWLYTEDSWVNKDGLCTLFFSSECDLPWCFRITNLGFSGVPGLPNTLSGARFIFGLLHFQTLRTRTEHQKLATVLFVCAMGWCAASALVPGTNPGWKSEKHNSQFRSCSYQWCSQKLTHSVWYIS